MDLDLHLLHAKRIRARLLRTAHPLHRPGLRHACGLASVLLAEAVGDLESLRLGQPYEKRGWHAWNVFGDTIVDITASQFNLLQRSALNVRGVLVTTLPYHFHANLYHSGVAVVRHIDGYGWYGAERVKSLAWHRIWMHLRARLKRLEGVLQGRP